MRNRFLFLVLLLFFSTIHSYGQSTEWSAVVTIVPNPSSFLSEWLRNNGTNTIQITYTGLTSADYKVEITVRSPNGKDFIRIKSPRKTFTTAGTVTFQSDDILNWDITYDQSVSQKIIRSNRFPEGQYDEIVKILTPGGTLLTETSTFFTIVWPSSPLLILPTDASSVNSLAPVFTWTLVTLPPSISGTYNLKIVERFEGQSFTQALSVNPAHHEINLTDASQYVYPQDALPFKSGVEYVWRVRVLDSFGDPLTSNNGNSEFWSFTYFNPSAPGFQMPFSSVDLVKNVGWFSDFSQLQLTSFDNRYTFTGNTPLKLQTSDGQNYELPATVSALTFEKGKYNPFVFTAGSVTANIPAGTFPASVIGNYFRPSSLEYTVANKLVLKGTIVIPNGSDSITQAVTIPVNSSGAFSATINSVESPSPIFTFGNSAVKVQITSYRVEFPGGKVKFKGKVFAFGNIELASFDNLELSNSGVLTGTVNYTTAIALNALQNETGKYVLSATGASGEFSLNLKTGESSIDISLTSPKFELNVHGMFKDSLRGSAALNAKLLYTGTAGQESGFVVSSISDFIVSNGLLSDHPLKIGNALLVNVNSMSLDSVTYKDELDFRFSLNLTYNIAGLGMYIGPLSNIIYRKKGISLPAITNQDLTPEAGGNGKVFMSGVQVEFLKANAPAKLWNGGSDYPMNISVEVGLPKLPVGSSDSLLLSTISSTAVFTATGMSITVPQKTYSNAFIQLPDSLRFKVESINGTITATTANNQFVYTPSLKVKGLLQIPAGRFGCSTVQELNFSSETFTMNGFGLITGTSANTSLSCSPSLGIFPLNIPRTSVTFTVSGDSQYVKFNGSGSLDLQPLTGETASLPFTYKFDIGKNVWENLSGSLTSSLSLKIPRLNPQFRLYINSIKLTSNGLIVSGRQKVLVGQNGQIDVTANDARFGFQTGNIAAGSIIFDKGVGLTVDGTPGLENPVLTLGMKLTGYPSSNGAYINTSNFLEYNKEGLLVSHGVDTAYITNNGFNYKTIATFDYLRLTGDSLKVLSGKSGLTLLNNEVAILNSQGYNVFEQFLPTLPEKIPILGSTISYILTKTGSTELVDYSIEGENIRVKTRPNQPVNAYFPVLAFGAGTIPELPVTFDILIDKTNHDIVSGNFSASVPPEKYSDFDLTRNKIPAKLRSFTYAKTEAGNYELKFKALVSLFNEDVSGDEVTLKINGSGVLSGDVALTTTKRYNLAKGNVADKIQLAVSNVTGSFNSELLNSGVSPQYSLDLKGSLKVKTQSNSYAGANANFVVTNSGIQINNYTEDNFSGTPEIDLGQLKVGLLSFTVPALSYSGQNGWNYEIKFNGQLRFTIQGAQFLVPRVENIRITQEGVRFPISQINGLDQQTQPFTIDSFKVSLRNFRLAESALMSLDPASNNINTVGFKFDFSVSFTNLPFYFPLALRQSKVHIQNAGFSNNFLSGKADSIRFNTWTIIPFGFWGGICLTEVSGAFRVNNNTQGLDMQVEAFVKLPNDLLLVNNNYWTYYSLSQPDNRLSISANGLITGSYLTSYPFFIRYGRTDFIVPYGSKTLFTVENGFQSIVIQSNNVKAKIHSGADPNPLGEGAFTFDVTKGFIKSANIPFTNAFYTRLPAARPSLTFRINNSVLNDQGLVINGEHALQTEKNTISTTFNNLILNPKDLVVVGGSFRVNQSFGLGYTSYWDRVNWYGLSTDFPVVNLRYSPALLMQIPAGMTMNNNKITFSGESTLNIRVNNEIVSDLRLTFENNPVIDFSNFFITQGSFAFYRGSTKAGFLDKNGLDLSKIGSVLMPQNLVLGDSLSGYIKLRQGDLKLVKTEEVEGGVRIRNNDGQTVQLFVPGLKYTSANVPVFNITMDVIVNTTTWTIKSGTIMHQAPAGQSLVDLSSAGIPLRVTKVEYGPTDAGYLLTIDGVTALPQSLKALETPLTKMVISNGKITGSFSKGTVTEYYNPSAGYVKMATIGTMTSFKMQGVEYTFGDNPSYKISGDIKTQIFKHGVNDTSVVHFLGTFTNNKFEFTTSAGSTDGLRIGTFVLQPTAIGTVPGISLTFTTTDFLLSLNGVLNAPLISNGFSTTVKNLRINSTAVLIDPVNITTPSLEQNFTLFASNFKLKNSPQYSAVVYLYGNGILTLIMQGRVTILGNEFPLVNFTINSLGGVLFNNVVPANSAYQLIPNRLWMTLTSVIYENNKYKLKIDGQYMLPAPAVQTQQSYTIKINSDQLTSHSVDYNLLNEAPGLGGGDATETSFWGGKYDVQYVNLNIDYSSISDSKLQAVSTFYVDGVNTHRFIKFGEVQGGNVEYGLEIGFDNSHSWVEELTFSDEVKFTYYTLRYELSDEDVSFDTLADGGFKLNVSGKVGVGGTGISGYLNFSGLEVLSTNKVNRFRESLTGGSIMVAPLITATLTRLSMSTDPSFVYIPDPNGTKETSGPDKGKVVTLKIPVSFYLVFGGSVELGKALSGSVDSFMVYKKSVDGSVDIIVKNFNIKKKDKFEFLLSLAFLTQPSGDFYLSIAGLLDVDGKVFAAYGKVAKWQNKFSAGIFVAALEGMELRIGPVKITGLGGGFFWNPTESDIQLVRELCGFQDEYTAGIKAKIATRPPTDNPMFTIFLYGRAALGSEELVEGSVLITIANDRLILDGRVDFLSRRKEVYGLLNIEVNFTQKFVEGTVNATINYRWILVGNSTMQFFFYGKSNWGFVGNAEFKVLTGVLQGTGDFYAGNKGFFCQIKFQQGFDVWIVSVNGGMNLKFWYKPDVSWGAYFRLYLEVEVLGGMASASGEVKGVLISAPSVALAGGASLRISILGISWSGEVWIKFTTDGVDAGFGKDAAVQRLIASAEAMSNDFLNSVNEAKAEMANKPIPTLGIDSVVISTASSQLLKIMQKARSLRADTQLSQAEIDSIGIYITSELAGGENTVIRNYLTALKNNILFEGKEQEKAAIVNLLNEVNSTVNDYKSLVSQVGAALSNLIMRTEVPEPATPEGVLDPVETVRFTFPTVRDSVPQPNDPTFELNFTTASNNESVVGTFMTNASGFHDMMKRNMEKLESTITKFDSIFRDANNQYIAVTEKYASIANKIQLYTKKLAEYYYNDLNAINTFRKKMASDSAQFISQIVSKDKGEGADRLKIKTYQRWARIRGLAGSQTFQTPWDHGEFESVWRQYAQDRKELEAKTMAENLYRVIPDQAFFNLMNDRKNLLAGLYGEFLSDMRRIEDHASVYTKMLDDLFAKRRKMSENLFQVVERFIYWKDQPAGNSKDISVNYKTVAPTLTTLQAKRTQLVASNTAPTINVNNATQTNFNSHSEVSLSWSATHPDGIVEYSLESNYLPGGFKSIGKLTSWTAHIFASRLGEQSFYPGYRIRARSGSGFTKSAVIFNGEVKVGFKEQNIGAPATTVQSVAPADNTAPYRQRGPEAVDMFLTNRMGNYWSAESPWINNAYDFFNTYYTNKTNEIKIKWEFNDTESGISSYRYRIQRCDGNKNFTTIRDWENIGAINEYLIQGLDLQHCATEENIRRSNYSQREWTPAHTVPRYIIAIEAINGAGLKNIGFVGIIVDTTKPPALVPFSRKLVNNAPIRYLSGDGKTVPTMKRDTTSNFSAKPVREQKQIVFSMNLGREYFSSMDTFYYHLYVMPEGIRINQDWIKDRETFNDYDGTGSLQGKLVTIPAEYSSYNDFKIEIMVKKPSGVFSPLTTLVDWYYPFKYEVPQKPSAYKNWMSEAIPDYCDAYWFNDRSGGTSGNSTAGNLKLYFKNLTKSGDGTGIMKYVYAVGSEFYVTVNTISQIKWNDLPEISQQGFVNMDASFFAPYLNQPWFAPGKQIYVYLKAVQNSFWAGKNITIIGPITIPPPTVANISIETVKDISYVPAKWTTVLTIGTDAQTDQKTYLVATQVYRNGNWVTSSDWREVRTVNMSNYHLPESFDLNKNPKTANMMPLRESQIGGQTYHSMGQKWRILIKVRDNAGNESDIVMRYLTW